MSLRAQDRSEWISDASRHLQERATERRQRRAAWRAAGGDPTTDPDRTTTPPDEPIARQLDRRRAAALRCAPLEDGRRDPFQPAPSQRLGWAELDRCAAALLHLQRAGLLGLPSPDVAQALARHPDRYGDVLPRRSAA